MFLGKRKNGIYFIEYLDPKTQTKKRISTGTKKKKEAMEFFYHFQSQSILPSTSKSILLADFQKEYELFIKSTYSPTYLTSVTLSFNRLRAYLNKEINIDQISVKTIQEFAMSTATKAEHAARLYIRSLKAAFNRAIDWGYIDANPCSKIKLGKIKKAIPKFISEEELNNIVQYARTEELRNIFLVAYYSGMRLSEILNLQFFDIDMDRKIIKVSNKEHFRTKNKKDRIIPVSEKIFNIFKTKVEKIDQSKLNNYVFIGPRNRKFNADFVSKNFKKALRQTNINPEIHFHSLRHSFASNLVQKGVSLYVVKELLGHEDISTTQIYSHLQSENLVKAIELL